MLNCDRYLHLTNIYYANTRTHLHGELRSLIVLFQSPKFYRYPSWGHALSLQLENIVLSSWPTRMKQQPWLQLLSRIAYIFRLGMVSSAGNKSVDTPIHRVLWRHYYVIFFVVSFVMNHEMYLVFIVVTLQRFYYLLHSKYVCLDMFVVGHSPRSASRD
jgi:hypothetical protein